MFFGIFITILHAALCLVMAYGVLFSKTPLQALYVLACLLLVFLGIRLFKGCCLTPLENKEMPNLSQLGKLFIMKEHESISVNQFEEIAVGIVLLLQIIRTATILLRPPEILF
jgi:uncharacterized membrane protein